MINAGVLLDQILCSNPNLANNPNAQEMLRVIRECAYIFLMN